MTDQDEYLDIEQSGKEKDKSKKKDFFGYIALTITFFFILFYLYFWLIAKNSFDDFNWDLFGKLKVWVPWYRIVLGFVAATLCYLTALMMMFIYFVLRNTPLRLHVVHVVVIVLILLFCVVTTVVLKLMWSSEWTEVHLSLKITGPFIQIGVVAVMTVFSGLVSLLFFRTSSPAWRLFVVSVYLSVMFLLYVTPLFIDSPCVVIASRLPAKPKLEAHRGASGIAPENTMMSFQYAEKYDVYAFESDVRISFDGVPFLLHDRTFRRTTNIVDVYPELADTDASLLNISQIKTLNAGSWFLDTDPMWTAGDLSQGERTLASNQTIPTLYELMVFVKKTGKHIMFDLMLPSVHHPYHNQTVQLVIQVIKDAGVDMEKVLWLEHTANDSRPDGVTVVAEEYKPVAEMRRNNISYINAQYTELKTSQIEEYQKANISINIWTVNTKWFFSLFWCMGITSTTTNTCHMMKSLHSPVWHLAPNSYLILWLTADITSIIVIITVFVVQRIRLRETLCPSDVMCLASTASPANSKEKLVYERFDSSPEKANNLNRQSAVATTPPNSSYPMTNISSNGYQQSYHSNKSNPDDKYEME